MKIKVAYWSSKDGLVHIVGEGETENEVGGLIASKFDSLKNALSEGIFYFSKSPTLVSKFGGSEQEMYMFIKNLFSATPAA